MDTMHTPCAVCKQSDTDDALLLEPQPETVVFLHTRCMGGLPLIALKWPVSYSSRRKEQDNWPTLQDYLDEYPQDLQDFEGVSNGGEKSDTQS